MCTVFYLCIFLTSRTYFLRSIFILVSFFFVCIVLGVSFFFNLVYIKIFHHIFNVWQKCVLSLPWVPLGTYTCIVSGLDRLGQEKRGMVIVANKLACLVNSTLASPFGTLSIHLYMGGPVVIFYPTNAFWTKFTKIIHSSGIPDSNLGIISHTCLKYYCRVY